MGIIVIILSFILLGLGLFLLFKSLKWVFYKKVRVVWLFSLFAIIVFGITINQLFFTKMEFVQSQVYSDLYLIKNPTENRNVLDNKIKEKVLQEIKKQENSTFFTLRFYEYSKGDWGESGTAYFIEHKERRDGMTAELLEYYPEYLIATYSLQPCQEEKQGYLGKLMYYNATKQVKTDTLLNSCHR